MYLASNSRPEIQFYFHHCARFTHNYWVSHEDAIICICRYLKDTYKRDWILSPDRKLCVNYYVHSDFSGLFSYEVPHDPVCAISQSIYVVTFFKCTILWISKLRIYIYLSNWHVKYVALSQSLSDILPFKVLTKESLQGIGLNTKKLNIFTQSSVFKDNSGAIIVASSPRLNPTTTFISVK